MDISVARKRLISVVTPVFNEEENIERCHKAIADLFRDKLSEYEREHIFCDNGSIDRSVDILRALAGNDRHTKVILNSRNFGILRSSFNGLLASSGDAVVALFPVDLQDPPEVILEFVRQWELGFEVVYGVRLNRPEGYFLGTVKALYYHLVSNLSDFDFPKNVASFQFLDRKVVAALREVDDYYPHLPGLIASCGFRRKGVPYTWRQRARGTSKNRIYHLVDEALNSFISVSKTPIRLCLAIGAIVALGSLVFGLVSLALAIYNFTIGDNPAPAGIPTMIVSLFFLSGVQFLVLGILGEYVAAIHAQVRRRPLIIERERINFLP